ncbi:MAG: cob(I)yrinic acid a,c-diamide adenosyltransferase [Chloroflexi bacterium]|nr:cob(I)yrinic acid a,c-diamide adenosyltransferase [Chloroflexota bacterium]
MKRKERKGLIIVHTGDGKGKTTAALGIALRAVGHDLRVLIVQFIKGAWHSGEVRAAKRLSPNLQIVPMGQGFLRSEEEKHAARNRQLIRQAWEFARSHILAGSYDVIVLDEVNYVISYGLLSVEEVVHLIREKPAGLHLILTGRNAHPAVIDEADLVTEMREIKHPFKNGLMGQRGIEF